MHDPLARAQSFDRENVDGRGDPISFVPLQDVILQHRLRRFGAEVIERFVVDDTPPNVPLRAG